jgi:hypothetical protein
MTWELVRPGINAYTYNTIQHVGYVEREDAVTKGQIASAASQYLKRGAVFR